jgi:hypothetical protein
MAQEQPPRVPLNFTHPSIQIPDAAQQILLPKPHLSILQFLEFPLPGIAIRTKHGVSAFFSQQDPTTHEISHLSKIPIPGKEVVQALCTAFKDAVANGAKSIDCPHVVVHTTPRLPLWTITYWMEVLSLHETRTPWVLADEALHRRRRASMKKPETRQLLDDVYLALSTLEWSGYIKGCGDEEPINVLAAYATHQWLTTTHENQILYLLLQDLAHDPTARKLHVEDLQFWTYINQAHSHRNSDTYMETKYFAYARGVGESLSSGTRNSLLTVTNVRDNHWVAWDLDFEDSCIRYGDSFRGKAPEEMMEAAEWWTYFHTGRRFTRGSLKTTRQRDGYSCGLFAPNSIAHRANPERYPLIDQADVDDERLKVMLKVIARHTSQTVSITTGIRNKLSHQKL